MNLRKTIRTILESIDKKHVVCQNCFHYWEIIKSDDSPYFCHHCGYDNKKKEFDLYRLKNWMKKYYKNLNESIDSERIFSGEEVNRHIESITPNEDNLPTWFMEVIIKPRKFKIEKVNLNHLLKTDSDFANYYDDGNFIDRYEDDDDVNFENLNNELVIVDGELMDGYNRASVLLSMGEENAYAFVALPKTKNMNEIRIFIRRVLEENYPSMIGEVEVAPGLDLSQEELNGILKGYLEAALWTEEERLKEDYEENYGYDEDGEDEDEDGDESELDKLMRIHSQFKSKTFESFVVEDLEDNSKIQAYVDIKTFIKNAGKEAVEEAIEDQGLFRLGMDIWLTRNGHGSGFFDYSYEHEKELMDAGQKLKSVDLYITDNLTLAFSNA